MITKEGQSAWTAQIKTENNSRRADVPIQNPDWEPDPDRKYGVFRGSDLAYYLGTLKIATKILE